MRLNFRVYAISAASFATLLLEGCITGLHPYASQHRSGAVGELLRDEVQGNNFIREYIAPAGKYMAAWENNDYVFYQNGTGLIERRHFYKWIGRGGIAVSKKDGTADLYTMDQFGVYLLGHIKAPFVLEKSH